jgi:hypothetical protein
MAALRQAVERDGRAVALDAATMGSRTSRVLRSAPDFDAAHAAVLDREAHELLETVAFGRDEETILRSKAIVRREAPRLAATNRFEIAARALGNICLFAVRALLHLRVDADARAQARECLRLIPDVTASPDNHPEDVRALLAAARTEGLGWLAVSAAGAQPSPCKLRIHGRPAGGLPARVGLVPGVYAVQADCGLVGMVREVTVRATGTERMIVAPALERALRLDEPGVLELSAKERPIPDEELSQFAEWLEVSELWTIERIGSFLRITRRDRVGANLVTRGHGLQPVAPGETLGSRIQIASARLSCEGRACRAAVEDSSHESRLIWTIAGGIGVTGMVGSWLAWARYDNLDSDLDELDPDGAAYDEKLGERDTWSKVALASTVTGSALFAGAASFHPDAEPAAWLAWTFGAVGVGAVGTGTVLWLRNGRREPIACPEQQPCLRTRSTIPLAPMLVSQGASLLAFPLRHLLSSEPRVDAGSFDVSVAPGEVRIGWRSAL